VDAQNPGDLGIYLLGLLLGLVAWIFNRESSRTKERLDAHEERLDNHSQRLRSLDGELE